MKYKNIKEEELKNKIAQDYFPAFDCTKIMGNVDFCVCLKQTKKNPIEQDSLLWAEAKTGASDIYNSVVQLILTIGKARTFDEYLPPPMLGALDGEKMAFIPYGEIHDVFYVTDFNWNVAPSNHNTKEFKLIHKKVKSIIESKSLLFNFGSDDKELNRFIKDNFVVGNLGLTKTRIDKNNFMVIYNKWLKAVKPTIAVNWEIAKKSDIIDGDFYLADLLSRDNNSIKEKLWVLLQHDHYILERKIDEAGMFSSKRTDFLDKQAAHKAFWNKYERPPKEEYWDYIIKRRDLLVPQDIRERKGSYFTPQIWVELSQQYLSDVFGEDWQDEYFIWDCAAGTGNLLTGLTNKYNVWASTLDTPDVEVMHDRIKNGANLLDDHVFQFDFLNDDFDKLPQPLQDIINDPARRQKLIVYINPPYAEGDNRIGVGRKGVELSKTHDKYANELEDANREMFAQFLIRIYYEIDGCKIAEFSKLKTLSGAHFKTFRRNFRAELLKMFIVPSWTFDNVKGKFPIGFKIWDTSIKQEFQQGVSDVYDENGAFMLEKKLWSYHESEYFSTFVNSIKKKSGFYLGWLARITLNDFQSNSTINILNTKNQLALVRGIEIFDVNLIECAVAFAVRKCIEATWLNDRDQFLMPRKGWSKDDEFKNDCFAYTLFSNGIQANQGINHWIPFSETEVNAREKFASNFMSKFIKGKLKVESHGDLFEAQTHRTTPLVFSVEAIALFEAGRKLWKYYHEQPKCNVNAALYDIREYFQGRNEQGKMNNKSGNETYTKLIGELRSRLDTLAEKIEPKVYKYGFLKK